MSKDPVMTSQAASLSFAEERFCFMEWLEGAQPRCHALLALEGALDVEAARTALQQLVARHAALRTRYIQTAGGPRRDVVPAAVLPLTVERANGAEDERAWFARHSAPRFDLQQAPLARAALRECGPREHRLLLVLHHLVVDAASLDVLVRDFAALYDAAKGCGPGPAETSAPYADFAREQREAFARGELEGPLAYWRGALAGLPPPLELNAAPGAVEPSSHSAAEVSRTLPAAALLSLCAAERVTPFIAVAAAFQALLARRTGQRDVSVGTVIANRTDPRFEQTVGLFTNTVALRTSLEGEPSFRVLLHRVRDRLLDALENADAPFEKVVEQLPLPLRADGRGPVRIAVLEDAPPAPFVTASGVKLSSRRLPMADAAFDLSLFLERADERVSLSLVYRTSLLDRAAVEAMAEELVQLLESAVAAPEAPVLGMEDWDAEARASARPLPEEDLIARIERNVAARPDAVALVVDGQRVTYAALNARANQLALRLRELGAGPETCVALALGRSLEWAVGMLGILKSGAARMALDPQLPPARRAQLCQSARPVAFVTERRCAEALRGFEAPLVLVDELPWPEGPLANVPILGSGDSLAQVVHTSGSTGVPKGVMLTRRALVNNFEWYWRAGGVGPTDRVLQSRSTSFDVAVLETLGAWYVGATLVFAPDPLPGSARELFAFAASARLTCLELTTAYWHLIAADLARSPAQLPPSVRYITSGGERARLPALAAWRAAAPHGVRWLNCYGPSETTITSAIYEVGPEEPVVGESPIGRPCDNTELCILDADLRRVPRGAVGELYIGGEGLARGYLGSPALTAERFIPHPYAARPGERLYRTGDRVRRLPDGNLDFVGRVDEQLKIRGFRVEPAEIDVALCRIPGVREAVTVALPGPNGEPRLCAYVAAEGLESSDILRALEPWLPPYLLPQTVVRLDALPKNTNGKVDRQRLPKPELLPAAADLKEPSTPTQRALADIWCDVLGLPKVSVTSDFFALGGHSLAVMQVASRIRERLQRELPPRALFEARTIEGLESALQSAPALSPSTGPVAVARRAHHPLTSAQERLWFLDGLSPGSSWFQVPLHFRLQGALDVGALRRALQALVERHESLRTRFITVDGEPRQSVQPAALELSEQNLEALVPQDREAQALKWAEADAAAPFDLQSGALLRATLLRLSAREHVLLLCLHHIVADGASVPLLLRELEALYRSALSGRPSELGAAPLQPVDFAEWQRGAQGGGAAADGMAYWRAKLAGAPPVVELPADRPRPATQLHRAGSREYVFPASLLAAAEQFAAAEGGTLFMVLVSAFKLLIKRCAGQDDVVVGSPIANRSRRELESVVGCLMNTVVLRTDLSGAPSFREAFRRVRETALGAYAHEHVPYERLVQELAPQREVGRAPLCQLLISLAPPSTEPQAWEGLALTSLPQSRSEEDVTEFDFSLLLGRSAQGLTATVLFSRDLFDHASVDRLMGHFVTLLTNALAAPDRNAAWLSVLSREERQRFLRAPSPSPRTERLDALIEQQVARVPDAVAVSAGTDRLTYAQLWARSGELAQRLRQRGFPPESRMAVYLEPSVERVVALVAILRAQGAFVALDPAYRSDRLSFVIRDCRAEVILTSARLAAELPEGLSGRVMLLERPEPASSAPALPAPSPEHLAYLLYTSGSTGTPKGASITHQAICEQLRWGEEFMALTGDDVVLHSSSIGFDVAVMEVFTPLVVGARLAIVGRDVAQDADRLARFIRDEQVSIIVGLIASMMQAVVESPHFKDCTALRHVMQGGEALLPQTRDAFLRTSNAQLHNCYGATEISIDGTCATFPRGASGGAVSIGTAIAGMGAYVLDDALEPVPVGVAGEICFAGRKLARGYWDRPALTAERFVPNPFSSEPGDRLYRTGDVARWWADGQLEFLGRKDAQVKLRGFRVELGDVEAALSALPEVRQARVLKVEGERLWAYVLPQGAGLSVGGVREQLKAKLPPYMVPAGITVLDAFPTLPNGKVNVAALPPPQEQEDSRGPREDQADGPLAQLWCELLGVKAVGFNDNFFELGGHSLLLVRLQSRIRKELQRDVSIVDLMRLPTFRQMQQQVERVVGGAGRRAAPRR